ASLGWPVAGGPWLRRPAAVIGLGVLLAAWLLALQRAIRVNRPPAVREVAAPTNRTAPPIEGRPETAPLIAERPSSFSSAVRSTASAGADWAARSGARRTKNAPQRAEPNAVRNRPPHVAAPPRAAAAPPAYRVRYHSAPAP